MRVSDCLLVRAASLKEGNGTDGNDASGLRPRGRDRRERFGFVPRCRHKKWGSLVTQTPAFEQFGFRQQRLGAPVRIYRHAYALRKMTRRGRNATTPAMAGKNELPARA